MLKIENLNITTSTGRKLVNDFSFVLNEGDKIALIGEEGNGKSTILKIIAGVPVDSYVTYTGKIICDEKIGYLAQSIPEEKLHLSVLDYISEEIDYNLIYTVMNRIGISSDLLSDRPIGTLSGGEKVKIALLKILYEQPDILLLDEPSNDLDLKTLIWLEEFIINTRLPLIFVSHDETLLENCANGILHLEQLKRKVEAKISFAGVGYDEYLESRNAFIQRNNMIAAKEKAQFNRQLDRWRRIFQKVEHQQRTISRGDPHGGQLLKKKMHSVKAQEKRMEIRKENLRSAYEPEEAIDVFFDEVKMNPDKVILDLSVDELKAGDKVVGKDIRLKVFGKDKICIIGENGTGKTTLMKRIYEELKDRDDITLGYMSQNYSDILDEDKTCIGFLWDGADRRERSRIQTFLGTLKFTAEEMEHRIRDLSEGQKCKILLASLILKGSDVLLLDEPTRNLSPLSNPRIRQILSDFKGTIISVSHDRKFIGEVINRICELKDGCLRPMDQRE